MKSMIVAAAAVSSLFITSHASAIEPLTAYQLQEACKEVTERPESAEARLCVYYVKGFLDGAVATDARVAENVATEIEAEETFSERAIRTRVINRMRDYGPSVYADFCVGQPDPIANVVLHVIEELERHDDLDNVQAQSVVYASLRRNYPCAAG